MGRIRTLQIKNLADTLLGQYNDKFTDNFEKNKKILEELAIISSKKIRNRLVGYITHVIKSQTTPKTFETPYIPIVDKKRMRRRK